jgi:tRNA nucleotidyltransferase (CCA-adding enzyme)
LSQKKKWKKKVMGTTYPSYKWPLPNEVYFIIEYLEKRGYKAYLVGGAVRDLLLKRPVEDYDITTDATPEELKKVWQGFPTVLTGEKHGTIGVILNKVNYEITSFRQDGPYLDHRRPESVTFTRSLEDDVKRRDFTINALAYHPKKGLIDYVGGLKDLKAGLITTVGKPNKRFKEDALRIMRAYRFMARYGFDLEPETRKACEKRLSSLDYIAQERITSEFVGLLEGAYLGRAWKDLRPLFSYLLPEVHYSEDMWESLDYLPADFVLRFTYILYQGLEHGLLDSEGNPLLLGQILNRFKLSRQQNQAIQTLYQSLDHRPKAEVLDLLKFLRTYPVRLEDWLLLDEVVSTNPYYGRNYRKELKELWEHIHASELPKTPQDLPLNGQDLLNLGMAPGPQVGLMLEQLWENVLLGKLSSDKESLLQLANSLLKSGEFQA